MRRWLAFVSVLVLSVGVMPALSMSALASHGASTWTHAPQGSWTSSYGADGYVLSAWGTTTDLVSLPAGVSVSLTNGTRYRWAESGTARAVESPDGSERRSTGWYSGTSVNASLTFAGGYVGDLALYMADYGSGTERRQTVTVNDGADHVTVIGDSFRSGAWVVVAIDASAGETVTVSVARTAGSNAVLSGLFLGGVPELSAPRSVAASPGDAKVTVSWDAPQFDGGETITGYQVYRQAPGETELSAYVTVAGSPFVDGVDESTSPLTNGQEYRYAVSALTDTPSEGPLSGEVAATPVAPASAPDAPVMDAAGVSRAAVELSWTPGATNGSTVSEFEVLRGLSGGALSVIGSVATPTVTFVDSTARGGTSYDYAVRTVSGDGTSPNSNVVTAVTLPGGDWVEHVGADGYVLSAWGTTTDLVSLPAGVSVSLTNGTRYRWAESGTARAVESPDGSERRSTGWYSGTSVNASLTFAGGYVGDLALYMADYGSGTERRQTVTVNDGADHVTVIGDSFRSGAWVVVAIDASAGETVTVSVARTAGSNAVLSGLFLGGVPELSAPRSVAASPGDAKVTVSWDAPQFDGGETITGYQVYRQAPGETELSAYVTVAGSPFVDGVDESTSPLTNGQEYRYAVSALTDTPSEGPLSGEVAATPVGATPAPDAPVMDAAGVSRAAVELSWTPGATNGSTVSEFEVLRGLSGGALSVIGSVATPTVTFVDSTARGGTSYDYAVRTVSGDGTSPNSNVVTAVTLPGGDWVEHVGADGYVLSAWGTTTDLVSLPAGVSVSLTNGTRYRWAESGTARAVESPDGSERRSTGWYSGTSVNASLTFAGGYVGDLALYMADYGSGTERRQTVTVNDGADHVTVIGDSFRSGAWVVVAIDASAGETVTVSVARTAGSNAVLSGLFLGGVPELSAPRSVAASPGDAKVTVSWDAPQFDGGETITGYQVYRQAPGETELSAYVTVAGSPFVDGVDESTSPLTNGQEYRYAVSALTDTPSEGPLSGEVAATPVAPASAPDAPVMDAAGVSRAAVELSWTPGATNGSTVSEFEVLRGLSGGALSVIGSVATPTVTFVDSTARGGTSYDYAVRTVSGDGTSPNSNVVTAVTLPGGDWVEHVGADGYVLSAWGTTTDLVSLPAGVSVSLTNGTRYRWAESGTARAVESPDGSERRSTGWYSGTSVNASLTFAGGYVGDLALYMADYGSGTERRQTVTVNDGADHVTVIGDSFRSGAWVVVAIDASAGETVTVSVARTAGSNAVLSGLFLGGVPELSAPRSVAASPGDAKVTVSWDAPQFDGGETITGYQVYRQAPGETELSAYVTVAGSPFVDGVDESTSPLTNGQEYRYAVSALTDTPSEGPLSGEVAATPVGATPAPGAPTLSPAEVSRAAVSLTWAPGSDSESATFQVLRGLSGGALTQIGSVVAPATSFVDSTARGGTSYDYAVKAVTAGGETLSNVVTAVTLPGGDWVEHVGADGYVLSAWGTTTDLVSLPAGVSVSLTNGTRYRWAESGTARAVESPDGSERRSTGWYSSTSVNASLTFAGGYVGDLALYMADYGSGTERRQTVTVNDGADHVTVIGDSFRSGAWVVVAIDASAGETVTVSVARTAGSNAVLSGLFLGGVPELSAPRSVAASPGDAKVTVSWDAPQFDGGETITGYQVYRQAPGETELSAYVTVAGSPFVDGVDESTSPLTNGQEYRYAVSALTDTPSEGPLSGEVAATPVAPASAPDAPVMDAAGVSRAAVELSWTPGATNGSTVSEFEVLRGLSGGALSVIGSVATPTVTFVDSTARGGTSYDYAVRTVSGDGTSPNSNVVTAVTLPGGDWVEHVGADGYVLSAWGTTTDLVSLPAGVSVSLTNGTRYRWAESGTARAVESPDGSERRSTGWYSGTSVNASLTFAGGYVGDLALYMADYGSGTERRQTVTVNDGADHVTVIGDSFRTGAWVVVAIDASAGETVTVSVARTAGSNAVLSGLFLGGPSVPSVPTSLVAESGDQQVSLSWTAPASTGRGGIVAYEIYRGTSPESVSLIDTVGTAPAPESPYVDAGLTNGTIYYYEVVAVNEGDVPSAPATASATPA